jgi:hypothetical protein
VLGFFSFTEVTDPTAHRAYNEWHQLDHLPEQFSIEGITFGQRWVCTPRCAEARAAASALLAPCHYMTLYLMRNKDVLPEFFALATRLRHEDRFFAARQSHLSGPFEILAQAAAPRVKVSAAAVPFRPAAGIYVVADAAPHGTPPTIAAEKMAAVDGVAGAWEFAELGPHGEAWATHTGEAPEGRRRITVAWVDGDLWAASDQLGAAARPLDTDLQWSGPLERVDPYRWEWFG